MSTYTSDSEKLVYTTPNLFVHGTIEKIVQNINVVGSTDTLFSVLAPCSSGQVPNADPPGVGCHAP